jgi:hypothetical protein
MIYPDKKLVFCIKNTDYSASLELRKIYEFIPDKKAEKHKMIRVIDKSGEDYLYPNTARLRKYECDRR